MIFSNEFNYWIPTRVYHGYGVLDRLGDIIKENKNIDGNFLLVTGKVSMKKYGFTDRVIKLINDTDKKVVLYDAIEPNPTTDQVDVGARIAVKEKCGAVIGFGGGSAIDTAKAIAIAAGNGGDIWEYIDDTRDTTKTIPIIAIPSTAGTGTEADRYFVITNPELKSKRGFAFDEAYPKLSIMDPELTESMPKQTTIDTAMDILGHSFESYVSKKSNPFGEITAINAIWLVFNYLPKVLKNGSDREARSAMMMASAFGGIAIDRGGVGTPHGVAMKLGGLYNITHGQGVGIILPYALENARPEVDEKLDFMAKFMGIERGSKAKNAEAIISKLFTFREKIGFYTRLSDIGIKKEDIPDILERCIGDEDLDNDPGDYSPDNIKKFLEKVI
jgi:alcohol dehydrogenase